MVRWGGGGCSDQETGGSGGPKGVIHVGMLVRLGGRAVAKVGLKGQIKGGERNESQRKLLHFLHNAKNNPLINLNG